MRLDKKKEASAVARASESPDQKKVRLDKKKEASAVAKANESPVQTRRRLDHDAGQKRARDQAQRAERDRRREEVTIENIFPSPTEEEMEGFEHSVDAAILLFHETGGLDRYNVDLPSPAERDNPDETSDESTEQRRRNLQTLSEELDKFSPESPEWQEHLKNCLKHAQEALDPVQGMKSCACCGFSSFLVTGDSRSYLTRVLSDQDR